MPVLEFLFNLNLFILSLDHLVIGGSALFFPRKAIKFCKTIFGADLPPTEEYFSILKPWGALGVFAGFAGILTIYDPVRYKGILYGFLILLITRILIRLSNIKRAETYFRLSRNRNLFHVFLIFVCASMIVFQLSVLK